MREPRTPFVILGALELGGPMSGYEIRSWIDQSVRLFWSESFGQIYPTLKVMDAKGQIARVAARAASARAVQRYRITPQGRKELSAWLELPPVDTSVRAEFLLKLMLAEAAPPGTAQRVLEDQLARAEKQSARLQELQHMLMESEKDKAGLVFYLGAVRHGQLAAAARAQWAREFLDLLKTQQAGGNKALIRRATRLAGLTPGERS